jgi:hypothetical protein
VVLKFKSSPIVFALVFSASCLAQSKGALTVAGKAIPLTNVAVYFEKGFFDEKQNDTTVVFSDHPLTDAQARDHFKLSSEAEKGKLHYVKVTINAKGQIINFQIGHDAFKFAPGGGSTEHQFKSKVMDAKSISGTVFTNGPQKGPMSGPAYEYKMEFSAPILPRR